VKDSGAVPDRHDVTIATPRVATKLSGTLVPGGEVWDYEAIP